MRLMALDFAGRTVLVVGGGSVATRKVRSLLDDGAVVHVVSPRTSADISTWAGAGNLTLSQRAVEANDLEGAWLVIAATDQAHVNAEVTAWANERQVWCVNASEAVAGSARTVAQSVRDGLVVGVASADQPDPGRVRAVLSDVMSALAAGDVDLRTGRAHTGKVVLVGAGPGAGDLITLRGRRALASAHVVIHDRLGTEELLAGLPAEVERIDVGKRPDHHPVPQERINELLVEHARQGKTVVRLKGGDPFVFGRGGEEVIACVRAGVDVEVVPGITSGIAAPASAGVPVTHRGVSAAVHISAAHEGLDDAAAAALMHGATVVLLMGVGTLERSVHSALAAGIDPHLPVAIVENGTLDHERVTRSSLADIVATAVNVGVKSPAVVVLGEVARQGLLT